MARQEREEAIEAVLAMVPPGPGERKQAIHNLRIMPLAQLLKMRTDLQAAIQAAPPRNGRMEALHREITERRQAAGIVGRGLARLKAARDAIQASRKETRLPVS